MSYNYKPSVILLIVSVLSRYICPSNSNVIPNILQSPIERQMIGKVFVDKSDSLDINANNKMDKRSDNKAINQKLLEQMKKASLEPMDVSLYGYASMIDPRALTHPTQRQIPPQKMNPEFQYNSYQQLFDNMKMSDSMNQFHLQQMQSQPNSEEEALHVMKNYLKKYDMKKYFLKKILGDAYDREEGHDEGFFANKHLRRHGGAGMAAKVFGELIGIKIRKTIENFGDTVSGYAKELTTNGFVTIGNTFTKLFRLA